MEAQIFHFFFAVAAVIVAPCLATFSLDAQASGPAPAQVEEIRRSKCNFSSEEGCTNSIILTYIKQGARPLSKQSLRIARQVAKKKGLRIEEVRLSSGGGYVFYFDKDMTNNQMFLVGRAIVDTDPDGLSVDINFKTPVQRIFGEI